ncbi:general substrate transporter [Dactylonectria estremocensis]|uniref:General substrate transporter n=1 Tax=Dactylonectria estremocensis TaxID=1079267 RepID=A0A9P9EMZ0_9HYPO|nr:general substrate transporter [Dactylonectria estremocensis]
MSTPLTEPTTMSTAAVSPDKPEALHHVEHSVAEGDDLTSKKQHSSFFEEFNASEHRLRFRDVARKYPKIIWWSFFWCMCAVGWGFDTQVNGAMVGVPAFRKFYGYEEDGLAIIPANWLTAFNVVSSVGQFFGGFLCSYISDRIGRKPSLSIGVLIATGAIFGETFSTTRAAFVVSKLILGVGVGFYLTLGPITCSEIAPTVLRGLSTAGVNLGIAVGQLVSNSVIRGFGNRQDTWAFKGPFLVQLVFSVFLFVGSLVSPESPWYLIRAHKIDEARKTLQYLYGSEAEAEEKLLAIIRTTEEETRLQEASYASAFRGTDKLRTWISIGVFACQHAVGIIFVLSFSTYFFQLAGLETSKALDLGVGVTACGVGGNICSWFIINRFGRRPIFLIGMVGCTVLLLLIGILDVVPTDAAKWIQSALTVVYSFVYFLTIGAVAFVLLGEVSSLALRARTTALATATQAIFGIIMFFAVPYMVNPDAGNLKGKVGFVFGGLSAFASVGCFFYIPELRGRTYSEIDAMFTHRVPPRQMGTYKFEDDASP